MPSTREHSSIPGAKIGVIIAYDDINRHRRLFAQAGYTQEKILRFAQAPTDESFSSVRMN